MEKYSNEDVEALCKIGNATMELLETAVLDITNKSPEVEMIRQHLLIAHNLVSFTTTGSSIIEDTESTYCLSQEVQKKKRTK